MKFGPTPLKDCLGAVVVHKISTPDVVLKKGEIIDAAGLMRLKAAGVGEIVVAKLEEGDIIEDKAAEILAEQAGGAHIALDRPFTGRCNLRAMRNGLAMIAAESVDAVNAVDEGITFATLKPFRMVMAGELIATVKIIPFAIHQDILSRAVACAKDCVSVAPFRQKKIAALSTCSQSLKPSLIDKTLWVLRDRLAPANAQVTLDHRIPHEVEPLATAIRAAQADMIIIFGASAIADRRDVVPCAIEAAGGRIEYFGMPVDPGNLLLLARSAAGVPIIGAPGCARSSALNGFDFILRRFLADIPVGGEDIKRMGVGGLLKEIVARPQPRE